MVGTIVNSVAIMGGSILGASFKKGIKERYKETMLQAMGLSATILGISSAIEGITKSDCHVLFIVSLAIGGLIGEWMSLDSKVNNLTEKFSNGSSAGTLSIVGPLESALNGNNTLLYTNAILDGVTSIVLASTFGISIIVSSGVLFLWQGLIYLSANVVSGYITPELLNEISIVGGILILSSGLGILNIKKINTLNLLPSLCIPVVYFFIKSLI